MKPLSRAPAPAAIAGEVPERTASGAAFSARFSDVYASRDGALLQAQHVFLRGNQLPQRWAGRNQFVILETGFGLGTNFLATWQAWRNDPARPRHLHFVSLELHPVPAAALRDFADPALSNLATTLAHAWPPALPGLHRLSFNDDSVILTLCFGEANALLPQLMVGADAFFLDGFAPTRNPLMWQPSLLRALGRCARPQATLTTWCVARAVQQSLVDAGFDVRTMQGFGNKREMTVAHYAPRWRMRRYEPPMPRPKPEMPGVRHAVVVGAGLAGCACTLALVRRGWTVTVLDAAADVASGASALPAGLIHPEVTADDSLLARITRAGHLLSGYALRRLEASGVGAPLWQRCGVLQSVADADVAALSALCERLGLPSSYARVVTALQAETLSGMRPRHGGWWFDGGGVVSAARWCQAMLAACGSSVQVRTGMRVEGVVRGALHAGTAAGLAADKGSPTDHGVGDAGLQIKLSGAADLHASVVIVATALATPKLLGLAHMPVRAVRGRASLLSGDDLPLLKAGLAGDGYAAPALHLHDVGSQALYQAHQAHQAHHAVDAGPLVGSTYETPLPGEPEPQWVSRASAAWRAMHDEDDGQAHTANLARLGRLLNTPPTVRAVGMFDAVRCAAHDRMPWAGAVVDEQAVRARRELLRGANFSDLPRVPGLYVCCALGSRGLTLAPLLAELLAAQIEGEPLPLERALCQAVDPGRVLLRRLRSGQLI